MFLSIGDQIIPSKWFSNPSQKRFDIVDSLIRFCCLFWSSPKVIKIFNILIKLRRIKQPKNQKTLFQYFKMKLWSIWIILLMVSYKTSLAFSMCVYCRKFRCSGHFVCVLFVSLSVCLCVSVCVCVCVCVCLCEQKRQG